MVIGGLSGHSMAPYQQRGSLAELRGHSAHGRTVPAINCLYPLPGR